MAKDFAVPFYNSTAWRRCRTAYIKSVNGLCERCLAKGRIRHGDIVHHKITLTQANINNPSITLNHENLEYLCIDCHNEEHMNCAVMREGLAFDESGQLIEKNE
ncbi:MAG: HNH endonuclease [Eubacteriales bacterium]